MPRVTDAHLTARRDQIIDAATLRFAANGFRATGMADIIAASGLSAGAVYRYFRSKDELVEAIAMAGISSAAAWSGCPGRRSPASSSRCRSASPPARRRGGPAARRRRGHRAAGAR
jgi:AcrR family transcriptional regulator